MFLLDTFAATQPSGLTHVVEAMAFMAIVAFLIYGNVGYQLTRLGHLERLAQHVPMTREQLDESYGRPVEPLLFLVPSYKEEARTVRQTLMSAALQEHPNRRVVLLIDDPQRFDDPDAHAALVTTRELTSELNALLIRAAEPFSSARVAFRARQAQGAMKLGEETARVASLYLEAARWFEEQAARAPIADHTDSFFVANVLRAPAQAHRACAEALMAALEAGTGALSCAELARHHDRLASLFRVELSSFERKRYANLSHEPNKAMNLNTYISLLGREYVEVARGDGLHLEVAAPGAATLTCPQATYFITLDADSLLLPDYALRLITVMEQPGNERIAVAQTPYSAIPGATRVLERTAGATTDIQYLVHQGFTHHRATFWVGANALLRSAALDEIAVVSEENGWPVKRYIQDRTVIEDTESTVDLIDKGWVLFNYPERLAYSATPPDFGSLVVQRGRWANGGLIILPKLLRYLLTGPNRLHKVREGFFRFHYLTSIAGVNLGLIALLVYPFANVFQSPWLPVMALPYYALYARDLRQIGYGSGLDLLRVYALNLLLLPVNVGGVLRSLHQAWRGHRIPFHRTPKISGRTCVPARYIAALYGVAGFCLWAGLQAVAAGAWQQAIFLLLNAAMLVYGILAFIGYSHAWNDLHMGVDTSLRRLYPSAPNRAPAR